MASTTKQLAIRGVAFNWLGHACTIAVTFFVTPILIHGLGNEAYGLWSLLWAQATYYALIDLGLRPAVTKYVAEYLACDDQTAINKVAYTSLIIWILLAFLGLLAVSALAFAFPFIFPVGQLDIATVRWVVFIVGLTIMVTLVENVFDGLLTAAKRFDLLNVITTGTHVVRAAVLAVTVTMGGGLLSMGIILLTFSIIQLIVAYICARRTFDYLSLSPTYFDWATARTLFRFGILNSAHGITLKITKSAGTIITGLVLGVAMVAFYSIADALVKSTLQLSKALNRVLMPVASQLDAQDRQQDLVRLLTLSVRVTLAMSVGLAAVLVALGQPLIRLWIGEEYSQNSYPVLCVLAAAMVFTPMANSSRNMLKGMNQIGVVVKVGVVDVALTLVLGYIGAIFFGMVGMALAVLVSQSITSGLLMPVIACRRIGLPVVRYLTQGVLPGFAAAIPSVATVAALGFLLTPTNLFQVVAYGILTGAVSGLSIFWICFERELRKDVIGSLAPFLRPTS